MVLDLWDLAEHAQPALFNGTIDNFMFPGLTRDVCAALQPVIILLGSIPRFYLNEFKGSAKQDPPSTLWVGFGLVAWFGAFVIWLLCSLSLTERLWRDGAAPAENMRYSDQVVVTAIVWLQAGYAIVSAAAFFFSRREGIRSGDSYNATLSFAKDFLFGTLDVLSKAGLALYCAGRSITVL